jgi:hypothetical protein
MRPEIWGARKALVVVATGVCRTRFEGRRGLFFQNLKITVAIGAMHLADGRVVRHLFLP